MQMQDYDFIVARLEGLVRRAKMFNQSKEDLMMNIEFEVENFRLAQRLEEEKMIEGLMAA
jgi:hypothetical protein